MSTSAIALPAVSLSAIQVTLAHFSPSGSHISRTSEPMSILCRGLASWLVGTIVIHVVAVLFGAPLLARMWSLTLQLASSIASLSVVPLGAVIWLDGSAWRRIVREGDLVGVLENALAPPAVCALVGAWASAAAIPLDWDRPWQAWPVPCMYGAVVGHVAGAIVSVMRTCVLQERLKRKRDVIDYIFVWHTAATYIVYNE